MIFLAADRTPDMFLILTERDIETIRSGRTVFVDERATKGRLFDNVVICYAKDQEAGLELIRKAGHGGVIPADLRKNMPTPDPGESTCAGCLGIMRPEQLFDGRCIVCWREAARGVKPC